MKKIDDFKELLNVLPRNNVKNSRVYYKKAVTMKEEATRFKQSLLKEIDKRYNSLIIKDENEDLISIRDKVLDTKKNLYLLNKYNDSYEKSSLDLLLYRIKKFYKNDLNRVNEDIEDVIDRFNQVGISLTGKDFFYGEEVNLYMNDYFVNKDNAIHMREVFDKLYWKEPDIILHIYLNFRYLYFKNIKTFDKYYKNRLVEYNMTKKDEYFKEYQNDLWNYLLLKESNIKLIEDRFINGELEIKDYEDAKTDKIESSLVIGEMSDSLRMDSLNKLSYTLYEYKNYLKYKYIIDEIKNIYASKEANKNLTKTILKNLSKHEGKLSKLGKKITSKGIFGKKKDNSNDKINNLMNVEIDEINKLYEEYDEAKFKEKIANMLNDNSSLLDALNIGLAFKINLFNILKIENSEKTDQEMEDEVFNIEEFSYYPNITFLSNISIKEERDISTIILDKYKLMNINIGAESLEDSNLDSFISNVNKVVIKNYMKKNNIDFSAFSSACDMKKILDKENHDKETK